MKMLLVFIERFLAKRKSFFSFFDEAINEGIKDAFKEMEYTKNIEKGKKDNNISS